VGGKQAWITFEKKKHNRTVPLGIQEEYNIHA